MILVKVRILFISAQCQHIPISIHYLGLNFTIRCCYDIAQDESEPITSDKQLVKSCRYVPLELDKEPPDFVERLDYLSTPFTFERGQLMLFLKSIHDKMAEAMGGSQDEEEDDSIIEVD